MALTHAQQLALVAWDLDTANVAEPFGQFVETGLPVPGAQMRLHRSPEDPASRPARAGLRPTGVRASSTCTVYPELGRAAFRRRQEVMPRRAVTTAPRACAVALGGTPRSGSQVIVALRSLTQKPCQRPGCRHAQHAVAKARMRCVLHRRDVHPHADLWPFQGLRATGAVSEPRIAGA